MFKCRCYSESVLLRFLYVGVLLFFPALEKWGGEQYDISLPSVINFHIVGLLEICLSLNLNALLLYYINALLFVRERFIAQRACLSSVASHLFRFSSYFAID